MNGVRWGKALLNGLLAWFIGFVAYMIPSFVYAAMLVGEMDLRNQDPTTTSQQISQKIADFYASNWLLTAGLIVVIALLVFWRARTVAKGAGQRRWLNGLIVGAVPAALSLLFVLCGSFGLMDIVAVLVYLGVGALSGYWAS